MKTIASYAPKDKSVCLNLYTDEQFDSKTSEEALLNWMADEGIEKLRLVINRTAFDFIPEVNANA